MYVYVYVNELSKPIDDISDQEFWLEKVPETCMMGNCCHRRPAPQAPPLIAHSRAAHAFALGRLQKKFGRAWKECGKKKAGRRKRAPATAEENWAHFVEAKLFQRRFHDMGETLKEIARNERAERR